MNETPPPVAPIRLNISVNGDDWEYVDHALAEIAARVKEARRHCSMASGGGGGSFHIGCNMRDVTPEVYHTELIAWMEASR